MRYFKEKQFKKDTILVVALYYCRFSLSYRDVSEILNERDISVHLTTLMCWVHECGTLIEKGTLCLAFRCDLHQGEKEVALSISCN
ncbi:hypothetical protein IK5_05898 [Bacillus cereus VD154]|uniref:Transposase n=1 Tax=Bacillus cereus VD154 TaxID=1053238 RepID=A0A9W5KR67_BACCE|nr:hypothetical protein IK5_05898 [Bacillus cereus VD154]